MIDLDDISLSGAKCLMDKSEDSWLWHSQLGHFHCELLNIMSKDIVVSLPKPIFVKDKLDLLLPGPRFDQIFPHSLSFPTLTTLSLKHLVFGCNDDGCVDPFSTFNMLTTLIIDKCVLVDNAQNLRISSTKLVNLTICVYDFLSGCNPRTADFEIYFGIELYAPTLHTFDFTGGHYIPKLFGSKTALSSIKHVNINLKQTMEDSFWENPSILFNWLVNLVNIESLTITKPALQVLSYAHEDLLKVDFPSLCNLKSLKFNQIIRPPLVTVIDFLLQNSPSAKVDFSV
ncbi:hypothetical protein MTR_8g062850 [Medicago truncatula]|uniref:Uncharacterized protein n=1 Tax=Medicago truncatula TaxID=3880 RepID=A0A072TSX8_MEDTR|nr:hypothetical protein MTR_8g062850 [Medicago truncatula]